MSIIVDNEFVKSYTKGDRKRHQAYKKTVEIYDHLRFHVDGYAHDKDSVTIGNPFFEKLIGEYRPGENDKVQEFRKKIYTSVSKQPCFKVINSLKKIIKSEEWQVVYKSDSIASIADGESLEHYCEDNYPKRMSSIKSWFYQFALRTLLTDPNSVVYTIPINQQRSETDYAKPFTFIANSPNVLDYKSDELAVILSEEKSTYRSKNNVYTNGDIVYVFVPGKTYKATQIDLEGNFSIDIITEAENMPIQAYRSGFGEAIGVYGNEQVYDSFLSPMLPFLDKMARENSDLDAAVVRHLHPKEWEYAGQVCTNCNGTGSVIIRGQTMVCGKCKGAGSVASPFTKLVLKPAGVGDQPTPTPPAGIVARDNTIIELQDKRVYEHGYNALATLNMEFLSDTPLNQSGVAKEVDRDELNNFVFGVAENLVEIQFRSVYLHTAQQRYWNIVSSEKIEEMVPFIPVPTKFDLLSDNTVIDRLKKMNDSGVDPTIISETQKDLANKMFSQDPDTKNRLLLIFELDPFTGMKQDEIQEAELSNSVTKKDIVMHQYVESFVKEAIRNNESFLELEFDKQKNIIDSMLEKKVSELSKISTPIPIVNPDGTTE